MKDIVPATLNGFFAEAYGWTVPIEGRSAESKLNILAGSPANSDGIRELVAGGLVLKLAGLGDEGFHVVTHESRGRRFLIIAANSPVGLKYGCQELAYFRMSVTTETAAIEWPMDIRRCRDSLTAAATCFRAGPRTTRSIIGNES